MASFLPPPGAHVPYLIWQLRSLEGLAQHALELPEGADGTQTRARLRTLGRLLLDVFAHKAWAWCLGHNLAIAAVLETYSSYAFTAYPMRVEGSMAEEIERYTQRAVRE